MSIPRKATHPADAAEAVITAALRRAVSTPHEFEHALRGTSCAHCSLGRYALVHGHPDVPEPGHPTRPWAE